MSSRNHHRSTSGAAGPKCITVFSGGTGSNRLTKGLLSRRDHELQLNILINAYDDGKSTGIIRRDFGMLGPSDIGKNLIAALDPDQPGSAAICSFMSISLSATEPPETLFGAIQRIAQGESLGQSEIEQAYAALPDTVQEAFQQYFSSFSKAAQQIAAQRRQGVYDLRDFRLRNVVFAGALLHYGRDYSRTILQLSRLLRVRAQILLNDDQDIHLAALTETGALLGSEAAIVDDRLDEEVQRVFTLPTALDSGQLQMVESLRDATARGEYLQGMSVQVNLSGQACDALQAADVIVFAPTTIESSLIPTLMSNECAEQLAQAKGLKVFVANLIRERGKRTLAEQLIALESVLRHELREGVYLHDLIDYVVVHSHSFKTDDLGEERRIPVDRHELESLGLKVIQMDLEDPQQFGYHDPNKLADLILSLAPASDENADQPAQAVNRLTGRASRCSREVDRQVVRRLLEEPLSYHSNEHRIQALIHRILGLGDLATATDWAAVTRGLRVVIAANGRGKRFGGEVPKPVYPIHGKPCLLTLAERVRRLDPNFLVVTNSDNDAHIRSVLASISAQQQTLVVEPRGSGAAVLATQAKFDAEDQDVMVLWCDAPNLQLSTMLQTLLVHRALGDSVVTMPTSWEANPYAGVERNAQGQVSGMFQTKIDPHKARRFGEHDASLFLFKRPQLFESLHQLEERLRTRSLHQEMDLLHAINLIAESGQTLTAIACTDARETKGFNTLEDVQRVEAYALELSQRTPPAPLDVVPVAATRREASPPVPVDRPLMESRFAAAVAKTYQALALDVDGNLVDAEGHAPPELIRFVLQLADSNVPVALITGRRDESLGRILLSKLQQAIPAARAVLQQRIYVYPYNGGLGYRLDDRNSVFYDRPLPSYLAAVAMRQLRKQLLDWRDCYDVTDYKITIWPYDKSRQLRLVSSMNQLLDQQMIPLTARIGGAMEANAAIVLTSGDTTSRVDKGVALRDFASRICVDIDEIAKVGDQGSWQGVDHELLVGCGSFSSQEIDPSSRDQISLPLLSELKNVAALQWLLPQLSFTPPATGPANQAHRRDGIQVSSVPYFQYATIVQRDRSPQR